MISPLKLALTPSLAGGFYGNTKKKPRAVRGFVLFFGLVRIFFRRVENADRAVSAFAFRDGLDVFQVV